MILKKANMVKIAVLCSFSVLCCIAYAEKVDSCEQNENNLAYEPAGGTLSPLTISVASVSCTSTNLSLNCESISVTYSLKKEVSCGFGVMPIMQLGRDPPMKV